MSLNETILRQLDDWRPADGRATLDIADKDSGSSVQVTADRNDELGTMAWELSIRRPAQSSETVRTWADRCAERVGALDPLKVLEIDQSRDEGMLRSAKPSRRGDKQFYYELMLKGTTDAKLRRFQTRGAKREQVGFPITHEALGRVVDEIV
jgi:hypothetical protein